MKQINPLFLQIITLMLAFATASSSFAMDVKTRRLTTTDDSTVTAEADSSSNVDDNLRYPGRISFILGYSHMTVNNGRLNDLSVTVVNTEPKNNFTTTAIPLNGITLGINQFITKYFGYELNVSYYLGKKTHGNYVGTYDPDPIDPTIVNANGSIKTNLLTTELLGMAGLHITQHILVVAKLGVGYERYKQTTMINATFTNPNADYVPYNTIEKNNKFGIAGGADLRVDLNDNFSFSLGVNDLYAKKNMLAYQATLLLRV